MDTKNLGEQAEQEFMSYLPNDDNRKLPNFTTYSAAPEPIEVMRLRG